MGFVVISVGDERSVAVHRRDRTEEPTVFLTPSVLSFAEDGTVALGDTTVPVASVVRVSTARVGQQQSVADEYRAEDLLAHAANCLVAMVTAQHGSAPTVALTVPDQWGPREHALLRDSFDHTGLHDVVLVADDDARRAFSGLGSSDESVVGVDVALAVGALSILPRSARSATEPTSRPLRSPTPKCLRSRPPRYQARRLPRRQSRSLPHRNQRLQRRQKIQRPKLRNAKPRLLPSLRSRSRRLPHLPSRRPLLRSLGSYR